MLSSKGKKQRDPLAMAWHSLSTTVLIDSLKAHISEMKNVWFADDTSFVGQIGKLKWYEKLMEEG